MGIWGEVLEPNLDALPPVKDGTAVRAIIGTTVCGEVSTKSLNAPYGQVISLFGLIVRPDELRDGCGADGAVVTFCIEGSTATTQAYGTFGGEPPAYVSGEIVRATLTVTHNPCPLTLPSTGTPPGGGTHRGLLAAGAALAALGVAVLIATRRAGS
jgi:hypothetical protein